MVFQIAIVFPTEHIVPHMTQDRSPDYYGDLQELTESIKSFGVLDPVLVRPRKDGGNDEAVILLADSNLHRPGIPPGKRAKACKMKPEAIR